MPRKGTLVTPLGLTPAQMQAQIDKAVADRLVEMPGAVNLEPVWQGIEDAKAQSAEEFANLRTMIRNRDPRLETLEGIAAVVQERTEAADIEHLSLHTTDADIYSRLDALKSLKTAQDSLDNAQQGEIDALELQFAQQLGQLQRLLGMPPSASAQDLTALTVRVKALEDARIRPPNQDVACSYAARQHHRAGVRLEEAVHRHDLPSAPSGHSGRLEPVERHHHREDGHEDGSGRHIDREGRRGRH